MILELMASVISVDSDVASLIVQILILHRVVKLKSLIFGVKLGLKKRSNTSVHKTVRDFGVFCVRNKRVVIDTFCQTVCFLRNSQQCGQIWHTRIFDITCV